MSEDLPAQPQPRPAGPGNRLLLSAVVVALIVFVIASYVGDALAPSLVNDHPLLLIALNSRIRYLVLTVNLLDPASYFVVGLLRNVISDPLFYLLGYWYGIAAVRWMEKRTRTLGELLATVEHYFGRFGGPLVFIAPNNFICLLAGASRMRPAVFLALNISGTTARLIAIKILGEAFETPIDWLLDFIYDYRLPLMIISVVAVGFTVWNETRKGTSEIDRLRGLEEELEGPPAGPAGSAGSATETDLDP